MHYSAMRNGKLFFDTYVRTMNAPTVLDIGAQDVNGSLRSLAPAGCKYVGVDFVQGKGVDVILTDPYSLPFDDASADVIVSSSCFEHSEMFWVLFLELLRVLKPNGVLYVNAPSNGYFHRWPVDCWRFYPDAGSALITWGKRNGLNPALLESYISQQDSEDWSDFVGVFLKDASYASSYPTRIIDTNPRFINASRGQGLELIRFKENTEDQALMRMSLAYRLKRLSRRVGEMLAGQPGDKP